MKELVCFFAKLLGIVIQNLVYHLILIKISLKLHLNLNVAISSNPSIR